MASKILWCYQRGKILQFFVGRGSRNTLICLCKMTPMEIQMCLEQFLVYFASFPYIFFLYKDYVLPRSKYLSKWMTLVWNCTCITFIAIMQQTHDLCRNQPDQTCISIQHVFKNTCGRLTAHQHFRTQMNWVLCFSWIYNLDYYPLKGTFKLLIYSRRHLYESSFVF